MRRHPLTDEQIRQAILNIEPLYQMAREYGIKQETKADPKSGKADDDCMYEYLDAFIASKRVHLVHAINSYAA